jgi:hypothetical protein
MILFKATGLREPGEGDEAHPDEDEEIVTKAFPIDDIRRMISIGEIVDLKTVAGMGML